MQSIMYHSMLNMFRATVFKKCFNIETEIQIKFKIKVHVQSAVCFGFNNTTIYNSSEWKW